MNNPVAIYFCGIFIYWHGIVMALAALTAVVCASMLKKAKGERVRDVIYIALFGFIPSMILGRVFYCYFMQDGFSDISQMLIVGDGGIALYGVAAGYLLTIIIYCAVRRQKISAMLDIVAPAAAAGICIGRLASYFSGDDIGRVVASESLQRFPIAVYSAEMGEWNYAVFVYEAAAALVIFCVLIGLFIFKNSKGMALKDGDIALLFLLLYGVTQTVFESMRGDALFLISLGFVRISQVISIILTTIPFIIFSIRSVKRGFTKLHIAIWLVCLGCIGLAFWMEFCITAATIARNYSIMNICLSIYLFSGMAFFMDSVSPLKKEEE